MDFIEASIAIVKLFPGEIAETYYIPAENKFQTKGKLRDAYNNYRTSLAKLNQITRRVRRKTLQPVDINIIAETNRDTLKDVDFLQKFVEPWEEVGQAWRSTYEHRYKILEGTISTLEYLEQFPPIVQPKGYELVSFGSVPLFKNY